MPVFFAAPLLVAINGFMIGNHRIGLPHARHRV
jgi:hypothetical protein